jgi:hypothetical protein
VKAAWVLILTGCAVYSSWASSGRLVEGRCLHVGARPASDGVGDYAATLQVSHEWGPCLAEDGGRP